LCDLLHLLKRCSPSGELQTKVRFTVAVKFGVSLEQLGQAPETRELFSTCSGRPAAPHKMAPWRRHWPDKATTQWVWREAAGWKCWGNGGGALWAVQISALGDVLNVQSSTPSAKMGTRVQVIYVDQLLTAISTFGCFLQSLANVLDLAW